MFEQSYLMAHLLSDCYEVRQFRYDKYLEDEETFTINSETVILSDLLAKVCVTILVKLKN